MYIVYSVLDNVLYIVYSVLDNVLYIVYSVLDNVLQCTKYKSWGEKSDIINC